MVKLIIICCELVTINMGDLRYSYNARQTDTDIYSITLHTTQKYNIGDTINIFALHPEIDWSDTTNF